MISCEVAQLQARKINRPANPESAFSTRNPLISPSIRYTVDGAIGAFKTVDNTVDNLSWLRVFASGHQVPYFRKSGSLVFVFQSC
jgi:hypothetical protein